MDRLWSPWRYTYIQSAGPENACIFCAKIAENRDRENYIVYRAVRNFVLLNLSDPASVDFAVELDSELHNHRLPIDDLRCEPSPRPLA